MNDTPDDPNPYEDLKPEDFDNLTNTSHEQFCDDLNALLARAALEYDLTVATVVGELALALLRVGVGNMMEDMREEGEEDE